MKIEFKTFFFRILISIISLGAINAQNSINEMPLLNRSDLEIIDGFTEDKQQQMTESSPFKNLLPLKENIDWTLYFKSLDINFIDEKLEVFKAFREAKITIDVLNEQTIFNTNARSKVNLIGIDYVTLGIIYDTTMLGVLPEKFLKTTYDTSISTGKWSPYTNPKNIKTPKILYNLNSSVTGQGYSVENVLKIWGVN